MSKFAIIPDYVIERLDDLTKRECVILINLYLHRNRRTGQCNPSKKRLAVRSKIGLNHVYSTLKSLAEKGWVREEIGGRFDLLNPYNVPVTQITCDNSRPITLNQSVDSRAEKQEGHGRVQDRNLSSPESGPKNSQIRTEKSDTYIEHFLTEKKQTNEQCDAHDHSHFDPVDKNQIEEALSGTSLTIDRSCRSIDREEGSLLGFPLDQLFKAFPNIILTPAQANMIQSEVKHEDAEAWVTTIQTYVGNHDPIRGKYLPERVGTLLNVFKDNRKRQSNGTNSRVVYKSEREKSAERSENTRAFIEQLRAEGLAERAEAERKRLAG
ncbi:MAG: helix-turn-helix domain-containing protein [Blastocatellia bacterium]|nr:helix-turn-helix domain-containing protein [Blastocatellia bacterium]